MVNVQRTRNSILPVSVPGSVLVLSLLFVPGVYAQTTEQRITELENAFEQGARSDRLWTNTWAGIYGTATVAYAIMSQNADDPDDRYDAKVSAAKTALATANLFVNPLPHRAVHKRYQASRRLDDSHRLALAEHLQQELRRNEIQRRSLTARLLPFAVNLTAGVVIGVGDDRPEDGVKNFAMGMLVNEIAIRTQPQTGSSLGTSATVTVGKARVDVAYQWYLAPQQAGVAVRF
ncbi:MAG TPA: hypothetical protein VK006_01805 [Marinobacter sp.]|nr:hypothetical protein [Marinobacter sp.]